MYIALHRALLLCRKQIKTQWALRKNHTHPETSFLLPDVIGNSFLASLEAQCCQGKDQMLPVYTCFTEVFLFV